MAVVASNFDGDDSVDTDDFFLFADHFNTADPTYDLNASGLVDYEDFFIFADYFGKKVVQNNNQN